MPRRLNPGDMRQTITIQHISTEVANNDGEMVPVYSTFKSIFAAMDQPSGSEFFSGDVINAEVITRFRIWHLSTLTPTMRILWKSRYFDIRAIVDPFGDEFELTLLCTERT